jgi:ABC-2 type transport system ATP-binding protein
LDNAISLRGLTKSFGGRKAVDDLSVEVPRGSLSGFIGPNGAGKTTTLRMITGILQADAGVVSIMGQASALSMRSKIGYLPEERGVYRKMGVKAFLEYMGQLKGVPKATLSSRIRSRLRELGLEKHAGERCEELSKGTQQKVQFLASVLHEPQLLILDEPLSGLDPVSAMQLRQLISAERDRGTTIVLSTHAMEQAEELCDRVVMINRGRKVLDDTLTAIHGSYDPRVVKLEPLHERADESPLSSLPEVERIVRSRSGGFEIHLVSEADPGRAIARIAALLPAKRIELARRRLEEVFISIVSADQGAAAQPRAANSIPSLARRGGDRV